MAILNVTPDSFSDGGRLDSVDNALFAAEQALCHGADILDIGGESTRPGARPVTQADELARVIPVIEAVHHTFPEATLSIDTRKAAVAQQAIAAGASLVNDVSGLQYDPAMAEVVASAGARLILMHSQGTPETMQQNPHYINVAQTVCDFLMKQSRLAAQAGVLAENLWLDPGFGFGKTVPHNLRLLQELSSVVALGYPVVVGLSRKSFLTLGDTSITPALREPLTAAAHALAFASGARIFRLHDVKTQAPVLRLIASTLAAPA